MENVYYINKGGKILGPFALQEVRDLGTKGQIISTDFVRKGYGPWIPATNIIGLISKPTEPLPVPLISSTILNENWFAQTDGETIGPFSTSALIDLIKTSKLLVSDLVWKQGMTEWKQVSQIPEVNSAIPIPPTINKIDSSTATFEFQTNSILQKPSQHKLGDNKLFTPINAILGIGLSITTTALICFSFFSSNSSSSKTLASNLTQENPKKGIEKIDQKPQKDPLKELRKQPNENPKDFIKEKENPTKKEIMKGEQIEKQKMFEKKPNEKEANAIDRKELVLDKNAFKAKSLRLRLSLLYRPYNLDYLEKFEDKFINGTYDQWYDHGEPLVKNHATNPDLQIFHKKLFLRNFYESTSEFESYQTQRSQVKLMKELGRTLDPGMTQNAITYGLRFLAHRDIIDNYKLKILFADD